MTTDSDIDPDEVSNIETVGGRDWRNPRIIDSNGSKYVVGYTNNGWFDILSITLHDAESDEDARLRAEPLGEYPFTSFTPEGVEKLRAAMEER